METAAEEQSFSTATSLTARQINRKIILNVIYKHQPISRADAARHTGLQRSTVSLIVDELIKDGWVIEGEHGRIPRGRRPIYLEFNKTEGGLYAIFVRHDAVELSVADLNGKICWTGTAALTDSSIESISLALLGLKGNATNECPRKIKGAGVAVEGMEENMDAIRTAVSNVFAVPVTAASVATACGKWFLLCHKDAAQAKGHLVSIHLDKHITMGAFIGGQPLRGAHGRAARLLDTAAGNPPSHGNGNGNGNGHGNNQVETLSRLVDLAIAAYDPGVILIAGDMTSESIQANPRLTERMKTVTTGGTVVRVIDTSEDGHDIYRNGATGLILGHFLDECSQ